MKVVDVVRFTESKAKLTPRAKALILELYLQFLHSV